MLAECRARYDEILEQGRLEFFEGGKKDCNSEDMKLLRRLKEYKREHLRFLSDFQVPFDNNLAEAGSEDDKEQDKSVRLFQGQRGRHGFCKCQELRLNFEKEFQGYFQRLKSCLLGCAFFLGLNSYH